jgi:hypothetical protein
MSQDASHTRKAIARLRTELHRPVGEGRLHRGDLALVLGAAERAARLESYVGHREGCGHFAPRRFGQATVQGTCTCGLDDVRAGRLPGEPRSDTWSEDQRRRGGG